MNRLQDNLIIYAVDPTNGSKKEFYNEKQKHGLIWMIMEKELSF